MKKKEFSENFLENYDKIAKTFSKSRKNMKWEEINYFFEKYLKKDKKNISILDVWCGSWRLLEHLEKYFWDLEFKYLWIDSSSEMIFQAKNNFSCKDFEVLDMQKIDELTWKKFDFVFFIASFHHKKNLKERLETLKNLKKVLKKDSLIFMTNWALESDLNKKKYEKSKINLQENNLEKDFWSSDFSIKIWEFFRYYHSFSLEELEFLFEKNDFEIIENRLFENKKNIISILKN